MSLEKKPLVESMPESDRRAWSWLRKDNEEQAAICLAELDTPSAVILAEEQISWAAEQGDAEAERNWRQKREEYLRLAESLEALPLKTKEMRWNVRDALARTLIHTTMNTLEQKMNRSSKELLPCTLIEHGQEQLGRRDALGPIHTLRHQLLHDHPDIPSEAAASLYEIHRRIRAILQEWHTHIYGELFAGADA